MLITSGLCLLPFNCPSRQAHLATPATHPVRGVRSITQLFHHFSGAQVTNRMLGMKGPHVSDIPGLASHAAKFLRIWERGSLPLSPSPRLGRLNGL